MKSPSRLTDIIAKSAATKNRAPSSRATSANGGSVSSSKSRGRAWATLGNTRHLRIVDEVRRARPIEQLLGDGRLHPAVAAERRHLIQDVAGMARAHRPSRGPIVATLQVRHHHGMER